MRVIKVRDREGAGETVALAAGSGEQWGMETYIPHPQQLGRIAAPIRKTGLCASTGSQASVAPPKSLLPPGQLGSLSHPPPDRSRDQFLRWLTHSTKASIKPCGVGEPAHKAAGGEQQLLFQLADAPSTWCLGAQGPMLGCNMAAAIPAPSKCCLFISLSDPVKVHEQFKIGSISHQ